MKVTPDFEIGDWEETGDGIRASRTFLVTEIDGAPASAQIKAATEAAGVPAKDDAHPEDSSIVVITKRGVARNSREVLVTCEYETPTWRNAPNLVPQEITLDSSIFEEKAWFDINDNRISVTYNVGAIITQYPSASRSIGLMTATVSRLETTSSSDLLLLGSNYTDAVNDAPWFNWPLKTWKLDDLQVRTSRLAGYREVSYVLTYNPRDWRFFAGFIDRGRVPPDATEGNGYAFFDLRQPRDFSALPITIPTKP